MSDRSQSCSRALEAAAEWLTTRCQVSDTVQQPVENPRAYPHGDLTGAMRTEYDTSTQQWSLNGPCFHTGQAIRALLVAARRTGQQEFVDAAERGASFLLRERIDEAGHPQAGLLLSLEQNDDEINVQVTVEALSGLLDLYRLTNHAPYLDVVRQNADILLDKAFLPDEGLMLDHYSLAQRRFVGDAENRLPGRAIVDDALFSQLTELTGDERYRDAFIAMADRLLQEEGPTGTWLQFPPWDPDIGRIHGRKNWWWGHPLLEAFDVTNDGRFLDGAVRAADWYMDQQNLDGGLYYTPTPSGQHNSFGVCTSVVACAIIFWADLLRRRNDERYLIPIRRGVGFLLAAQFNDRVNDVDVRGAMYESPHPPDGTLAPGYLVRDLAAIFAIRALDAVLDIPELLDGDDEWRDTSMAW